MKSATAARRRGCPQSRRHVRRPLDVGVAAATVLVTAALVGVPAGATTVISRVSVSSTGAQANSLSGWSALSPDGKYVAFSSYASNLVPNDTDGQRDVFLRNRVSGKTTQVSLTSAGKVATCSGCEGSGVNVAVSSAGRSVAFESSAPLVAGDVSSCPDVTTGCRGFNDTFVKDMSNGAVTRVGTTTTGRIDITPNGRYVAFTSEDTLDPSDHTPNTADVYVRDRDADNNGIYDEAGGVTTTRVSAGLGGTDPDDASTDPSISADGRYVTFQSAASNLVPAGVDVDPTNCGPTACHAVDVFVRDVKTGTTTLVSTSAASSYSWHADLAANGRYIAYESAPFNGPGAAYGQEQVRLYDRDSDGNGVYDEQEPESATVTVPTPPGAHDPAINADGRFVAYQMNVSSTVGTSVFLYDRQANTTSTVSDSSGDPSINANGTVVAFTSAAPSLAPSDTNNTWDVFVRAPMVKAR